MNQSFFRPQALGGAENSAAAVPTAPLSWRLLGSFLVAATLLIVVFISTAGYARKETAIGALVSTEGVARVSARRHGVVTALRVREGDRVRVGDPLFTIDSQQGLEGGGTLGATLLASLDAQTSLIREQIAADPARVANEIVRLDATIESVIAQRDAIAAQRALQAERAGAAEERRETLFQLYQKGSVTKLALQVQEETVRATRQDLAELDEELATNGRELQQARLQRDGLPVQARERLSQRRLDLADRERERSEIEARGAQVIRAPVAGLVTALQVGPGQAVDPNRPLLTLVPDGAELRAELFVPSRAIGFVEPGQRVRLMIDAFPYQSFGSKDGMVETVSQAILAPDELFGKVALREPAYRVTVRLKDQAMRAFGRDVPLQPDMSLQADIVLEERSLMAWLFEPLFSLRGRM